MSDKPNARSIAQAVVAALDRGSNGNLQVSAKEAGVQDDASWQKFAGEDKQLSVEELAALMDEAKATEALKADGNSGSDISLVEFVNCFEETHQNVARDMFQKLLDACDTAPKNGALSLDELRADACAPNKTGQGGGRRRSARRARGRGRSARRGSARSARRARGRSGRRSARRSKRARGRRVSRRR
jgi:hypothetical protein